VQRWVCVKDTGINSDMVVRYIPPERRSWNSKTGVIVARICEPFFGDTSVLHTVHESNGVLIRFLSISALFALDIGICLTYIPEKMSMCHYMIERDRKG
jgi:hypothetical protein